MILSVETSTRAFSAYIEEDSVYANFEIVFSLTHSQGIVQTVDFMLKRIGKKIEDVKEIYAGLGPGSFTGIRVGLSFANTLSQVLDIPLGGASSLDVLSFEVDGWKSPIIPFIRSRKDEVYTSFYKDGSRFDDFKILKLDDFIRYVYKNDPNYLISSKEDYLDIIKSQLTNKINSKNIDFKGSFKIIFSYPKAKNIPALIKKEGRRLGKSYLKPIYVRSF